jgi:hypothetical protein
MSGISRGVLMTTRGGARALRGMRPFGIAVAGAVGLIPVLLAAWILTLP